MSSYGEVLKVSGVARIFIAQLTARFPFGMLSLAFLLHVEFTYNSYTIAGLVLGAASIGQAFAGPLTSRWMGKWGMRPVLILCLTICSSVIAILGLFKLSEIWLIIFAAIAGMSTPPIQSSVRTIYPKMVTSRLLTPLFSLDATAQEIIWVAGPVVIVFVISIFNTVIALIFTSVMLLIGGIWYISSPALGKVRIPPSKKQFGAVLSRPSVLLATFIGLLLIGACASVEVGVVSVFGHGSITVGYVLAVFSIGSIIGGLYMGRKSITPKSLSLRMTIVFIGLLLMIPFSNPFLLSGALTIAGFGVAPALAVLFAMVSSTVKFSETAEAYAWVGTGQLIGAASGSAVAGVLVDISGSSGAFIAATIFAFFGAVLAFLGSKWIPDLRYRDASPIPDTEPVSTIN